MVGQKLADMALVGALSGLGIIAQVPATEIGDFTKYGVIGALVLVVLAVIYGHNQSYNRLADEVKESSKEITTAINAGNDKVATLLQSTLVQVLKDRHDGK